MRAMSEQRKGLDTGLVVQKSRNKKKKKIKTERVSEKKRHLNEKVALLAVTSEKAHLC